MLEFQNGKAEAFETLYNRYRRSIFSFLVRRAKNRAAADDLIQEVFARVIRGARGFQHGSRFSTWVFTIARNLVIDEARKGAYRAHASLDRQLGENGPTLLDRLPDNGPGPDRSTIAKQLRQDLAHAIEQLPDEQREVFLLREYHGIPFKEIAKIVDAKEGTVKSRMRYALSALRNELKQYAKYAEELG